MSILSNIDVSILCGGLGKRLRSEIGESQKVMAKVGDDPFLDILLKDLSQQGFKRVILCTGFQAQTLEDYYRKNNLGLTIEFSREKEPLGTGGAVKLTQTLVQSDPFVVMNGDCYSEVNYQKLVEFYRAKKARIAMVVTKTEDAKDFGTITLDDKKRIISFQEKIAGTGVKYINTGIYCFEKNIYASMPPQPAFSLEMDVFPKWAGKEFYGFEIDRGFIDIGTPERYKKAQQMLKRVK